MLEGTTLVDGHVKSARLIAISGDTTYEVRDFIPRFSDSRNYARNFGLQWQIHAKTQLDSCIGATYRPGVRQFGRVVGRGVVWKSLQVSTGVSWR